MQHRGVAAGLRFQLGESQLRCSVDGYKQAELALSCPDLGDVDVHVADEVIGKALLLGLIALHLRQAADAVPLKAAVQRRMGQVRDRGPQAIEAVVQRQHGGPPGGDDDGPDLWRQDGLAGFLRSHGGIGRLQGRPRGCARAPDGGAAASLHRTLITALIKIGCYTKCLRLILSSPADSDP